MFSNLSTLWIQNIYHDLIDLDNIDSSSRTRSVVWDSAFNTPMAKVHDQNFYGGRGGMDGGWWMESGVAVKGAWSGVVEDIKEFFQKHLKIGGE